MEMFFVGALAGIVISNVWAALLGWRPHKLPPLDREPPRLLRRKKHRKSEP